MDALDVDNSPFFSAPGVQAKPPLPGASADGSSADEGSFAQILHALDLRHFSLAGTIYRAVTGDTLPAPLRAIGSVAIGFLTGGPIGAIGSAVLCAAEEIYDLIDPPDATALASVAGDIQAAGSAAYRKIADAPGPAHA